MFKWLHSFEMPWWLRAALVWFQELVVGFVVATALFAVLYFSFLRDSAYVSIIWVFLYFVIAFGWSPLVNYLRNLHTHTNDQDHNP